MSNVGILSAVYTTVLLSGLSGVVSRQAGPKDLMICRPITEVFGLIAEGKSDVGLLPMFRGPQGPEGPIGNTGSTGPKGEPRKDKIMELVNSEIQKLNGTFPV